MRKIKPIKSRIKLLIAALRSGDYEQGSGRLKRGNKFCCLGVACEVYRKTTNMGRWREDYFSGERVQLPGTVRKWFGFSDPNPPLGKFSAIGLNDGGKSFTYIANQFERTYIKP